MNRKNDLLKIINKDGSQNDVKAAQLIDEVIFIEEQLAELRKLPFINVNPNNSMQQKTTPAAKLYKELLQQYNNSLKLLFKLSGDMEETEEESPLRKWVRSRKEVE